LIERQSRPSLLLKELRLKRISEENEFLKVIFKRLGFSNAMLDK